jgi:hypothetical protein
MTAPKTLLRSNRSFIDLFIGQKCSIFRRPLPTFGVGSGCSDSLHHPLYRTRLQSFVEPLCSFRRRIHHHHVLQRRWSTSHNSLPMFSTPFGHMRGRAWWIPVHAAVELILFIGHNSSMVHVSTSVLSHARWLVIWQNKVVGKFYLQISYYQFNGLLYYLIVVLKKGIKKPNSWKTIVCQILKT